MMHVSARGEKRTLNGFRATRKSVPHDPAYDEREPRAATPGSPTDLAESGIDISAQHPKDVEALLFRAAKWISF